MKSEYFILLFLNDNKFLIHRIKNEKVRHNSIRLY